LALSAFAVGACADATPTEVAPRATFAGSVHANVSPAEAERLKKLEEERRKAEEEARKAEEERRKLEAERAKKAEEERVKAEEEYLKQWETREKERIKVAVERTKKDEDALKRAWDQYKKDFEKRDPTFLTCEPKQYTGDVKIIGPEGGNLSVGPHKLIIPPGALKRRVVITGEVPLTDKVEIRLSPHGLKFAKSVTLELNYKHCLRPTSFPYTVAYIDDSYRVLEWPSSYDAKREGEVSAGIEHFSGYAVAYRTRTRRGY